MLFHSFFLCPVTSHGMNIPHFVYAFTSWWTYGFSHLFSIINNVAMNIHVQVFVCISPGCSLEGLMLRLKLQYFGHLIWRADSFEKTLMLGGIGGRMKRGQQMVGWHHQLDGHGFGWTLGVGDGQKGLACCGLWGCKESDMTERLNWTF